MDIVERLDKALAAMKGGLFGQASLLSEAKAEIERLRSRVRELESSSSSSDRPAPADDGAVTISFEQLLAFAKQMVEHATEDVTYENPEDVQETILETMHNHGLADVVLCDHDDCTCPDPDRSIGYWAFSPLLSETIRAAKVTAPTATSAVGQLEEPTALQQEQEG